MTAAFWFRGWGFDRAYDLLFVRPFYAVSGRLRIDPPDRAYDALAALSRAGHRRLSISQSGRLRWYATGMAVGLASLIAIGVLL